MSQVDDKEPQQAIETGWSAIAVARNPEQHHEGVTADAAKYLPICRQTFPNPIKVRFALIRSQCQDPLATSRSLSQSDVGC